MARCHEGFQHAPHAPAQLVVEKVSVAVPGLRNRLASGEEAS